MNGFLKRSNSMNRKWKNPGQHTEYKGLYNSWCDMKRRAGNKGGKWPSYSDVTICERWNSYDNFFEDMAPTWFKGAALDKDIIKPGNRVYCPEYCKWVDKVENNREALSRIFSEKKNYYWQGKKMPEELRKKLSLVQKGRYAKGKKVKCIETEEIFESCKQAEIHYNLPTGSVNRCANPKSEQKSSGGYHWSYIE